MLHEEEEKTMEGVVCCGGSGGGSSCSSGDIPTMAITRLEAAEQQDARSASSVSLPPRRPVLRLDSTVLGVVFQHLTLQEHLASAASCSDWWRAGSAKLAWVDQPPLPVDASEANCLSPEHRGAKAAHVRSLSSLVALSRSSLMHHVHTLVMELRFDFTVGVGALLVSLPSLTSLTMRVSDRATVSHAGVATCFAHDAANGWANRLRELVIGEVAADRSSAARRSTKRQSSTSSITSLDASSSSLDRGISLDHLVGSVHLLTLYVSHLDKLEVLLHFAYHHLDYSRFEELRGLDCLNTIVVSRHLPHTRERVENLRRLPALTHIDWRGEGWSEPEDVPADEQPVDSWQLLLAPIVLPTLELADEASPPSSLHSPLPLRVLHIHGRDFRPAHLAHLVHALPTLRTLSLVATETLFEHTGLRVLEHLEAAWIEAAASRLAHGDDDSAGERNPPLHTLCIERYDESLALTQPSRRVTRSWEVPHVDTTGARTSSSSSPPLAGIARSSSSSPPLVPSSSPPPHSSGDALDLDSSVFRLRHLTLASNLAIVPTEWPRLLRRTGGLASLESLHLLDLPLTPATVRAFGTLERLAELKMERCVISKDRSGSGSFGAAGGVVLPLATPTAEAKQLQPRGVSASFFHALSCLSVLRQLSLLACAELRGKDLLLLRHAPLLEHLTWADATYLTELIESSHSHRHGVPRPRSPDSLQRHATAWNADYLVLQQLQHAISPTRYPLPPPHARSRSLVQRLKGLAQALRNSKGPGCLDLPEEDEQQPPLLPPAALVLSPSSSPPFSPAVAPLASPSSGLCPALANPIGGGWSRPLVCLLRNQAELLPLASFASLPVATAACAHVMPPTADDAEVIHQCEPFLLV